MTRCESSPSALLIAFLLCVMPVASVAAQDTKKDPIKQRFETLDEARDHAGMVSLWREHPGKALVVIDSYLEGSLSLVEKSDSPDASKIRALHERALRGARAADEALGRRIFSDYASAFVGWTREEQRNFRAGQGAYGQARSALKSEDYQKALAEGQKCVDLARPLGDWWGMAMGYSAVGAAQEKLGQKEAALAAHTSARMIYFDLGLQGSEYRNLRAQCRLLMALGREPRARVSLGAAIELARVVGDTDGQAQLEKQLVQLGATSAGVDKEPTSRPRTQPK